MAGNVPPSLGDNVEEHKFRLVRETYELPKQRKDIVSKFEQVLNQGGVQKIVVQLGKPILVDRLAKAVEDSNVPFELSEDDLWLAARNAPIGVPTFNENPTEYLFSVFDMLAEKGAQPRAFYVDKVKTLQIWLKRNPLSDTVCCVEVRETGEMPQDAGLLIGVDPNEPDQVMYSVRFEISMPKKKERKS